MPATTFSLTLNGNLVKQFPNLEAAKALGFNMLSGRGDIRIKASDGRYWILDRTTLEWAQRA